MVLSLQGSASAMPVICSSFTVTPAADGSSFTLAFQTDVPTAWTVTWYPLDAAIQTAPANTGSVSEAALATNHAIVCALGSTFPGRVFGWATSQNGGVDATTYIHRAEVGSIRLPGSRTVARQNATPVRFYNFGGTPPAPAGGGTPPAAGNWSQYTWAQYAPKSNAFPN
jgi:hypothetical protein